MKQQAALPPGSPRDEGRPNTARNLFKQFHKHIILSMNI